MKTTLLKPFALAAFAISAVAFTSCVDKGDDTDFDELFRREEVRIDSLLRAQKPNIEAYVQGLSDFPEWQEDTVRVTFSRLPTRPTVNRGIWYRVVSDAAADNTYSYSINSSGTDLVPPMVKLKYKASLLNGTEVQSDETGTDYSFGVLMNNPNNVFNLAWYYSFFPYSLKFNGDDKFPKGLTKDGLRKGSKLHVVVPSCYAFDQRSLDKIPANSPLVYEFEVLEIQ